MPDRDRQPVCDPFAAVVAEVLHGLPEAYQQAVQEVAIYVEDEPSTELKLELGMPPEEDLFGLYTGTALTERSVETDFDLPPQIQIFRGPLKRYALELAEPAQDGLDAAEPIDLVLRREIRVTLLHELGHHFGLDEDQLEALGYG